MVQRDEYDVPLVEELTAELNEASAAESRIESAARSSLAEWLHEQVREVLDAPESPQSLTASRDTSSNPEET